MKKTSFEVLVVFNLSEVSPMLHSLFSGHQTLLEAYYIKRETVPIP